MDGERLYTIETEFRSGYLWALVGGERLTADIARDYWEEIAAMCKAEDCDRILIEKDFKIPVGPEDMIRMAEHVSGLLASSCIAFVDRRRHDVINELGKRLARNHQIKMQVFPSAHEAEKWLLAN